MKRLTSKCLGIIVRRLPSGVRRQSGFTLIELLIVTVVIVTLMDIVFWLASVASEYLATTKKQRRLPRLEAGVSG